MHDYTIITITGDNVALLQSFKDEAGKDGYMFIDKTISEWQDSTNTFSKPGEKMWGMVINGELIAIGGLNQDMYADDPTVGRVRHVYVAKKYRGRGLSKVILKLIIDQAKVHFKTVRLFTHNPIAALLYESQGFQRINEYKATHCMKL